MAKKLFPLLAILFLLMATPSFAKDNENKSGSTEVKCDDDANWENHGAFVSCVAHLNLGGTSVSTAAHSNIGKHKNDEDENDNDDDDSLTSPTPSPSPSATPTASPSISPTPTASPSATPSTSPSPSPTPETVNTDVKSVLGQIIQSLQALMTQLQNLIAG